VTTTGFTGGDGVEVDICDIDTTGERPPLQELKAKERVFAKNLEGV
jgi:hypothetical protein